jgi:hypothetical protein
VLEAYAPKGPKHPQARKLQNHEGKRYSALGHQHFEN